MRWEPGLCATDTPFAASAPLSSSSSTPRATSGEVRQETDLVQVADQGQALVPRAGITAWNLALDDGVWEDAEPEVFARHVTAGRAGRKASVAVPWWDRRVRSRRSDDVAGRGPTELECGCTPPGWRRRARRSWRRPRARDSSASWRRSGRGWRVKRTSGRQSSARARRERRRRRLGAASDALDRGHGNSAANRCRWCHALAYLGGAIRPESRGARRCARVDSARVDVSSSRVPAVVRALARLPGACIVSVDRGDHEGPAGRSPGGSRT